MGNSPPAREGVLDYYRWMRGNHWEWVILAVRAPVEAVAPALITARVGESPEAHLSSNRWRRDVPVRAGRELDEVSARVPLVRMRNHEWTVALYQTFWLSMPPYHSAQVDGLALSRELGTTAFEFSSEDTSGATGYHLFERGDLVEFAEWGGGRDVYASRRQPEPPWAEFPVDSPHALFREYGLYIPPCYARDDADQSCLAVDGLTPAEIERVDLLDLRGSFSDPGHETLLALRQGMEVHVLCDEFAEYLEE